jgi:hypothetical protein
MTDWKEVDFNEWGNFLIRMGYLTGCLRDPRIQAELIRHGAKPEDIDGAFDAITKLANCFYQVK